MIPQLFLGQRAQRAMVRMLVLSAAAILGLSGWSVGQPAQPAKAQAAGVEAKLFFSPDAQGAKIGPSELGLRPNLAQQAYLYIQNLSTKQITPSVELRVAGKVLTTWTSKEAIKPNSDPVRINFVEKPPQPGEKPPELVLAAGPIEAVAVAQGAAVSEPAKVIVVRPDEYVDEPSLEYNAKTNILRATIRAKAIFTGPPARVELVLLPDRIPALIPGQKKIGSFAGYLTAKESLTLFAQDAQFRPGVDPSGLVYLTIDGYERAFTYYATFTGSPTSTPQRINTTIMRLNTTGLAPSGAPSKVGLEVDNLEAGTTVQLGLYRTPSFTEVEGELEEHIQERDKRILFSPLGPNGALLFRTEVRDWPTNLQTADVFGKRLLRLRSLDKAAEEAPFIDAGAPIVRLPDGKYQTTKAIVRGLTIDGSKPENVDFLDFPKQLARGSDLPVKATGIDPESGIAQVVFFTGKPQDDGKIPPTATKVEGKPAGKDVYEAKLQAPTDKKGTFDVSVAFINGVGLVTIRTVQIELVDAKAATGGASITGTVVFGDNPIPGQEVLLRDPQGNVKDTTKTGLEGATRGVFTFKNVAPGTYQIVALNTALRANGQAAVQVGAGEDKKLPEPIVLRR
jgi:hypothetical protein